MENIHILIKEILEVIEFAGDRETHIERFLALCNQRVLTELLTQLPQSEIQNLKLANKNVKKEEMINILASKIDKIKFENTFNQVGFLTINEYLKPILSTISYEKRRLISGLLEEFKAKSNLNW